MKSLRSPFALVLSGTPLENRLDDLFSVVEFIDDRRLGPAFRFFNRHRVTDEKGKVLGYGQPGSSDYDEIQAVLHRFFQMDAGKDYKVIAFQGQPERIAALVNDNIQAAGLTVPHAAVAELAGLKVLLLTGDYIARAGGTIWCTAEFVQKNPETVKKLKQLLKMKPSDLKACA